MITIDLRPEVVNSPQFVANQDVNIGISASSYIASERTDMFFEFNKIDETRWYNLAS